MIGVSPRRFASARPVRTLMVALGTAGIVAFCALLPAQTTPTDEPSLPSSPDGSPAPGTNTTPVLPPYSPSNNAASPLLPSSPPLPPHPSVPDPSLLPDSTPRPVATPFPLPVPEQPGSGLSPTASGSTLLNGGAPAGYIPADGSAGGAATTGLSNSASVRRFQYAFRITTGVAYDDNIFLGNSNLIQTSSASKDDTYFSISPSVSLGYGDFLSRQTNFVEFDYNLNALIYTKNSSQTSVQHFVNLQGAYHFAQVTLSLAQGVQILKSTDLGAVSNASQLGGNPLNATPTATQVNLDASQRTGLNIYSTTLDANYAFSDKTSIDLGGGLSIYNYETLISSETYSANAYFNYAPTGKITLGIGVTGGYVIQDKPAPDEYYQQGNLRLSYTASGKLSFAGSVGVQARETSGVSGTEITPVFDLTANYAPFNATTLALVASRQVQTSAVLAGQNFNSTSFSLTASQTFYQKLTARLSLGYTYSSYTTSGRGVSLSREDNYYFVQPALDYAIRDNLNVGIFYAHRQNFSTGGLGFADNQIGARISFNF